MKDLLSPIDVPEGVSGDHQIIKKTFAAHHKFSTANMRCQFLGGQKAKTVSWPHPTTWTYLTYDGGTWMSDIPCEHAQMIDCIKGIRGHVLVGGLGLGMVAVLLAKKKAIKTVTVVEKSQDVINLVAEHTTKHSDKIKIVHHDLFDYLDQLPNQACFTHAFYDIWQSDGEGTFFNVVCPLLEKSKGKILYEPVNWNEDVMRGQLMSSLMTRLLFSIPQAYEAKGLDYYTPIKEGTFKSYNPIYHNWSVPFFQWIKEKQPEQELAQKMAKCYAYYYGRKSFDTMWRLATTHNNPNI